MLRDQPKNGNEINYADAERGVTYRAYMELSDSDEADMDISGSDGDGPSAKRARTVETKAPAADSVPKWSNPDPYTALPPPGASQSKKKDVVQLIRKSRVQAEESKKTDIPEKAAEYISCDFSDDEEGFVDETKAEVSAIWPRAQIPRLGY
jgi:non-canonical poly(A) RNA polymerase PAPD5/7